MRKFHLFILVVLSALGMAAFVPPVSAGCPVTVLNNNGSDTINARAPIAKFVYERAVYLIRASEVAASGIATGDISGIGWSYLVAPGVAGAAPLKVYLENTSDTTNTKSTFWATAIIGMTLVHDDTTTLPDVVGSFDIPFSGGSAFTYTGGGVYVAFDWGPYTGTKSTVVNVSATTTLTGGVHSQQNDTGPPVVLTVTSNFRAETRLTGSVPASDVSIDYVIAMGEIPLGLVGAQTIQATVFQYGDADLTNVPVTLDITGTETVTETLPAVSLLKCGTGGQLITFTPFTPALTGLDTLTVSLDERFLANDTLARALDVTTNRLSFEHAGTPPDGGIGFSGTAEIVAKFQMAPTQVDAISVSFFTATATKYRLVIRDDDKTGKPGPLLYLDGADRSVTSAGKQTIVLSSPVGVGGTFFVGIRQTNTINANYSYNDEYPLRPGTFFFNSPPFTLPWTEFADPKQLNIGVTVGNCLVPLSVDVTPNTADACVGSGIPLTVTASGSVPHNYRWTENGLDIPGATGTTYTPMKATAGSHTYNCRVTDGGGCSITLDSTATTATWVDSTPPPETATGPGSADQLLWSTAQDVVWPPNPNAASYTLYRGDQTSLPDLLDSDVDSCTRYGGAPATATGLTELPLPGEFYWYIVTGTSVCDIEGPAGSSRVVNSSGSCP